MKEIMMDGYAIAPTEGPKQCWHCNAEQHRLIQRGSRFTQPSAEEPVLSQRNAKVPSTREGENRFRWGRKSFHWELGGKRGLRASEEARF